MKDKQNDKLITFWRILLVILAITMVCVAVNLVLQVYAQDHIGGLLVAMFLTGAGIGLTLAVIFNLED